MNRIFSLVLCLLLACVPALCLAEGFAFPDTLDDFGGMIPNPLFTPPSTGYHLDFSADNKILFTCEEFAPFDRVELMHYDIDARNFYRMELVKTEAGYEPAPETDTAPFFDLLYNRAPFPSPVISISTWSPELNCSINIMYDFVPPYGWQVHIYPAEMFNGCDVSLFYTSYDDDVEVSIRDESGSFHTAIYNAKTRALPGKKPSASAKAPAQTGAEESGEYQTLKPGSKGQAVLDARMKLYELGYFKKKPTQKEFTNNMKDYVKKFEKDYGLTQDGILSPEDQEILFSL